MLVEDDERQRKENVFEDFPVRNTKLDKDYKKLRLDTVD